MSCYSNLYNYNIKGCSLCVIDNNDSWTHSFMDNWFNDSDNVAKINIFFYSGVISWNKQYITRLRKLCIFQQCYICIHSFPHLIPKKAFYCLDTYLVNIPGKFIMILITWDNSGLIWPLGWLIIDFIVLCESFYLDLQTVINICTIVSKKTSHAWYLF